MFLLNLNDRLFKCVLKCIKCDRCVPHGAHVCSDRRMDAIKREKIQSCMSYGISIRFIRGLNPIQMSAQPGDISCARKTFSFNIPWACF